MTTRFRAVAPPRSFDAEGQLYLSRMNDEILRFSAFLPPFAEVSPTAGDVLVYNSTTGNFESVPPPTRLLSGQFTNVGNIGTGEDNLMTYTMPANTFVMDGQVLQIRAFGTLAANANSKTLRFYFGAGNTAIPAISVSTRTAWMCQVDVVRTGVDAQDVNGHFMVTDSTPTTSEHHLFQMSTTADDGAGITIKLTGTATANNDIVQASMVVVLLTGV